MDNGMNLDMLEELRHVQQQRMVHQEPQEM